MLEKIGMKYYEKLSTPNHLFLEYIKQKINSTDKMTIAEIGIGIGSTTQAALRILRPNDLYYIFDYSDKIDELCLDLNEEMSFCAQIIGMGNSRAMLDNYVWSLYRIVVEKKQNGSPAFDLILLDGAHDYTIDLAACALIIDLLKTDGILIVDDMYLNVDTIIGHNPIKRDELEELYSSSQSPAFQMRMICESYLDLQSKLHRIVNANNQAVYLKK